MNGFLDRSVQLSNWHQLNMTACRIEGELTPKENCKDGEAIEEADSRKASTIVEKRPDSGDASRETERAAATFVISRSNKI
jgi:hypothetical protein